MVISVGFTPDEDDDDSDSDDDDSDGERDDDDSIVDRVMSGKLEDEFVTFDDLPF